MPYRKTFKTRNSAPNPIPTEGDTDLDGEMNLMRAVIDCAFRDYIYRVDRNYDGCSKERTPLKTSIIKEEAREWLLADDPDDQWPFTLRNICLVTGRSVGSIRRNVINWEKLNEHDRRTAS